MQSNDFSTLGLAEPILRALQQQGYETPTPIQAKAIPVLLEGRDMLGIAQTGTGKTAAFTLPILDRLVRDRRTVLPGHCRALILAPTRELAVQISESVSRYGRNLKLRHCVILGGVAHAPQIRSLRAGADIVVATPGRLLDMIESRHLRLDETSILVLDEADRMLDMGFIRDVRKIVAKLPRDRQSLLFSATMPQDVAHLAAEILNNPVRVDIAPKQVTADRIEQGVYFVSSGDKRALLVDLANKPEMERVIVFTRTKHGADKVAKWLELAKIEAAAIHGNKSQNARQAALNRFRSGSVRVLVATDIAARGIDVVGISHVINFDLPNEAESYVHRIGRTARASAAGIAISFCDASEAAYLRAIEKLTGKTLNLLGGERPVQIRPAPAKAQHRRQRPSSAPRRRAA